MVGRAKGKEQRAKTNEKNQGQNKNYFK